MGWGVGRDAKVRVIADLGGWGHAKVRGNCRFSIL